ncbi:MAG: hypothetical protein GXP16_11040, partial [Gammaproteobacteria bacterium]|nr:hypothetical protein [Gammaproteobacteria bacterium]
MSKSTHDDQLASVAGLRWEEISSIESTLHANRQPSSDALVGRELVFVAGDAEPINLSFNTDAQLKCYGVSHRYDAVEAAPGLFLVGFQHSAKPHSATFLVIDFETNRVTEVGAEMPTVNDADTSLLRRAQQDGDLSPVRVEFHQRRIGTGSVGSNEHQLTDQLVGKRVRYVYSDGGIYEHIYLNPQLYTWHCLAGSEQGLADTDACTTLAIRPDIYLFCWREKIIP